MFQPAPGVSIPFPERIAEQFEVYENQCLRANISFEKLQPLVTEMYQSFPEPLFFVLQLPLTAQEEQQTGQNGILHQAVYYLDGQTQKQIDSILDSYGEVLWGDGISQFAIASHANHEEVFVQKYKLTDLYSAKPRRFIPLLERYGLEEAEHLVTVWDTFSQDAPGQCRRLCVKGLDAYEILERLQRRGMYKAKIIEEP